MRYTAIMSEYKDIVGIKQIENNTGSVVGLPPTATFPVGIRLVPGLNTVPKAYLTELDALEAEVFVNNKPTGKFRHPGRERIAALLEPVKIVDIETGKPFLGPMITIYRDEQVGRPEGPPPPHDLSAMDEKLALKMVDIHNDVDTLKRWRLNERRRSVKAAIDNKIGA